jgi:minor extracellular serine protease Vpr
VLDLLAKAVNRFDRGGMVIAIAAGNTGPSAETIESPGFAERAIAAGGSTVGHFVGVLVTTVDGGSYAAASGDFATVASPLTKPLDVVTEGAVNSVTGISTACAALTPGSLSGEIALISRGTCTFSIKISNAQAAGAVAVLMVNNVAGDPIAMAFDDTQQNQPSIPAYMVGLDAGKALKAKDGVMTTIHADLQYIRTTNDNLVYGSSSLGPTDVNFRVKPDVVAPAVNVLSSQPRETCDKATPSCWAFFQGTSMATPHISGSAAVVIDVHPDWSSADVRSAIVNTAERGVLKDAATGTTVVDNPNIVGAGLANLHHAVLASVSLDPVSLSFGGVPSGSGQSRSGQFLVKNLTDATATFTFSIDDSTMAGGVTYAVSPGSVTLGPGQTARIDVSVNSRGNTTPDDWAWLEVSMDGSEVAHAALYTRIK